MKKLDWCFLIHLSDNMWADYDTPRTPTDRPHSKTLLAKKDVWDEVTEFAAKEGCTSILIDIGDAIQYKSHPEIAIEGAWSIDEFKAELARLRGMGLKVYPKLNFSAGHDAWLGIYHRMVSTPTYYQVCKDLINEVIDIFGEGLELFHLGMDEEYAFNQQKLDFVCYRQYDLLWSDMNFFCDVVRERGVRPWMWSDHYWKHPKEFVENIGKDVLLSPWKYLNFYFDATSPKPKDEWDLTRIDSYTKLPEFGYDIMPCFSNFHNEYNTEHVVRYCQENVPADKMPGFVIAPWFLTTDKSKFSLLEGIHLAKLAKEKYGY